MATGAFADRVVCHPGKSACPLQSTGASPSSQTESGKSFVTDEESRTLDLWQKIRTSLIDHNEYLIDYTTAFEVRIGEFRLYHTGDSGSGTEPKLNAAWGRPRAAYRAAC